MDAARPPDRPVRLWVLDEMRYGLHGFTRRVHSLVFDWLLAQANTSSKPVYSINAIGMRDFALTKFLSCLFHEGPRTLRSC